MQAWCGWVTGAKRADTDCSLAAVLLCSAPLCSRFVQSVLRWLSPLLPSQPRSVRQLSHRAANVGWTCSIRAVERDTDRDEGKREDGESAHQEKKASGKKPPGQKKQPPLLRVDDVGQSEDWTIEATLAAGASSSADSGVPDELLQACVAHAGQLACHATPSLPAS